MGCPNVFRAPDDVFLGIFQPEECEHKKWPDGLAVGCPLVDIEGQGHSEVLGLPGSLPLWRLRGETANS